MAAAKSEAESLVNDFKSDLESKHQAEVNSQQGASNTEAAKLTGESGKQIKGMQSNYNTKKDEVENMLAGLVTKVNNVPPKARQQAA
jgi:vacuolar-type H+-ATPase subunit H|tara:strand:- start:784 stop:1044 length:261 start_codon:yes stop_codon:yes gene_type:complete